MYSINDTITAITTPLGTGGVGVIRISGTESISIINRIFSSSIKESIIPDFKANKIYHGWIVEKNSIELIPVDEVILLIFKAPNSFTGEDIIEIQCHGGINIVRKILSICLKNGARLAQKGEFTKRAFINGKLDLCQAESVLDIIHSKTDKFSSASAHNLSGKLSIFIKEIRAELLNLVSITTAAIDFPEEVDEPDYSYIIQKAQSFIEKIDSILKTAQSSNLMRQGIKIAMAGKPNVGKSSLFNKLLNLERSIVTDIPGTTRDVIQESLDINGIPVTLIDTAGIRELEQNHSSDYIESIGIDITKKHLKDADIILSISDLTESDGHNNQIELEISNKPIIKIGSKLDLINYTITDDSIIPISSKTGEGIENIKHAIEKIICTQSAEDTEFCTNIRHQECLNNAKTALFNVIIASKEQVPQDFILIDLKTALISLGEITGEVITDEILENIFENFCIGK